MLYLLLQMGECTLSFHEKQLIVNYIYYTLWDFYLIIEYTECFYHIVLKRFDNYVYIIILTIHPDMRHCDYRKFSFKWW